MAIGDDALNEGYGVVPDSGENGRVRWGAREINRTRDYIALLKQYVRAEIIGVTNKIPTTKTQFRTGAGIRSGTANPSGGENGDIYFKII